MPRQNKSIAVYLRFGILAPTLMEQLSEHIETEEQRRAIEHLDNDSEAIHRLRVRGIIPASVAKKAQDKISRSAIRVINNQTIRLRQNGRRRNEKLDGRSFLPLPKVYLSDAPKISLVWEIGETCINAEIDADGNFSWSEGAMTHTNQGTPLSNLFDAIKKLDINSQNTKIEKIAKAIFDAKMSDGDAFAKVIHESEYIHDDVSIAQQLAKVMDICRVLAAAAIGADK